MFRWDFDPIKQRLGEHEAAVTNLNPERIFSGPGVARYHFTTGFVDLSLVHQYEGVWPLGHGYRDTLRMQIILFVTFVDNTGTQQHKAIHTEECFVMGDRYYEE